MKRPFHRLRALITTCLFLVSLLASAQDKMSTDRPDQTDGASALHLHDFQFETEIYLTGYADQRSSVISSSLLRYGLFRKLEVRLLAEQGRERAAFLKTAQGFYPLSAGIKYTFLENAGGMPDLGIIAHVQLPFTNHSNEPQQFSPSFTLAAEKEIGRFDLAMNAGPRQEVFASKWFWQLSGDIKYDITPKLQVFGEYFTQIAPHQLPNQNADAGLLYHLNERWMIYGAVGERIFTSEHTAYGNSGFAFSL